MTNDPEASYNVSVDCGTAAQFQVGLNSVGNMTCPGDSHGTPTKTAKNYISTHTNDLGKYINKITDGFFALLLFGS